MSKALLTKLWERALPPTCALCHQITQSDAVCTTCETSLPWILLPCIQCGLPLTNHLLADTYCGRCLQTPPPWHQLLSPYLYHWPVSTLIARFKYRRDLIAGNALSQLLSRHLFAHYESAENCLDLPHWPDLLIPVPLHWRRQWWRGFNQTEWLAHRLLHHLSQMLQKPGGQLYRLPTLKRDYCRRLRHTPNQKGLSQRYRKHNLDRAFEFPVVLNGQHVALLDDVVTTGSTVAEISRGLSAAGAGNITVWSLCRTSLTPRSGSPLE